MVVKILVTLIIILYIVIAIALQRVYRKEYKTNEQEDREQANYLDKWEAENRKEETQNTNNCQDCQYEELELTPEQLKEIDTMYLEQAKELMEYKRLEQRLNGVTLEQLANAYIKCVEKEDGHPYTRGRILTNEDADKWDAYLKAEEQGLFVQLPCKVGDTVYEIIQETVPEPYNYIGEYVVDDVSAKAVFYAGDWIDLADSNLYLTREAAEAKLKEMYIAVSDMRKMIQEQPTVYDVDKVMEQIQNVGTSFCTNVHCNTECSDCDHGEMMKSIIKIVKAGEVNDHERKRKRQDV